MHRLLLLMLAAPSLAACGEAEKAAPAASETAVANAAASPAAPQAQPAGLEAGCRDVVKRLYGQEGVAVTYETKGEGRAAVSWRAPVDGGVLNFECRNEGDTVGLFREGRPVSVNIQPAAVPAEQEAR